MPLAHDKIFVLPALGVDEAYYAPLIQELTASLNASVSTIAPPGPGNWRQRLIGEVRVGYVEMIDEICRQVLDHRARHPKQSVLLLGHSLGGHFAMLAASRLGAALDGIVLVASGTPHWRSWPQERQWRIRIGINMVNFVSLVLPWYPGQILGFGGNQPRLMMRDWVQFANRGSLSEIRTFSQDTHKFSEVKLPLLTICVEGDTLAPQLATEQLLSAFPNVRRSNTTLGARQLPGIPVSKRHFAWCRQPAAVCQFVKDWSGSA